MSAAIRRIRPVRLPPLQLSLPGPLPGEDAGVDSNCPFELDEPAPVSERPSRAELLARARGLAAAISGDLGRPVRLVVTDNRSTMLSYRRSEVLTLRLHHMFLEAPEPVVRAIAEYAGRGGKRAGQLIDAYVRAHGDAIRCPQYAARPSPALVARGETWNLQEFYDHLNARWFEARIEARIGWGRAASGRRRRTIRMGVYDHLARTIRVHPALDRPEVPGFFVAYIVFHEMLHQAVPARQKGGRRQHHGPEFRTRERAYPDYERALAWERDNLGLLLGRLPVRTRAARRAAG